SGRAHGGAWAVTVSGIIRDALYERAEAAQPGLLVKGSSLILGPMQPAGDGIAHKCVALHVAGGGPRQVDYMRGLNTLLPAGERRVPVYFDVRSDVGHASFLDGEALAWFVYDLLHGKPP